MFIYIFKFSYMNTVFTSFLLLPFLLNPLMPSFLTFSQNHL